MLRVAVLDDHPAVLTGLRRLIDSEPDLVVAAVASSTAELARELDGVRPDVLILDYELPRGDGLSHCAHIKRRPHAPRVIVYSAYAGPALTLAARAAQADGVIDKAAPVPGLVSAIRRVADGEEAMDPIAREVFEAAVARLDDEDLPVLAMLLDREPLDSIADALRADRADVGRRAQRIVGRLRPRLGRRTSRRGRNATLRRDTLRQVDARPVICAFDASSQARRAVEAAAWLAETLRAPLEVIHVFDEGVQPALPREGALMDPLVREKVHLRRDERTRARMRRMLRNVVDPLLNDDVETLLLDGRVVPTLHDAAAERDAVLLVSGTAARAGLEHVLQGSVAGTLAANAPCPVVTVPPEAAIGEPGPVLVGDDGSDHAQRAVRHAAALADSLGRELVRIEADGDDAVRSIATAGRELRACLIATGTRGRGAIRAKLFGSVSAGLVQATDRPIMLVPASAGDAPAAG